MEKPAPIRRYAKYLLKRTSQVEAAYGMLVWLAVYNITLEGVKPAWFDNRWGFRNGYTANITDDARFFLGGGRTRIDLADLAPSVRDHILALSKERAEWFEERVDDERVVRMIRGMFGEDIEEVFCRTEQRDALDAANLKRQKRLRKRATAKRTRKTKKTVAPIEPTPWD